MSGRSRLQRLDEMLQKGRSLLEQPWALLVIREPATLCRSADGAAHDQPELEPVFVALASWGSRSPHAPLTGELSDDTVMLGLRTFFRPAPARCNATFQVHLGHETYHLRVRRGRLVGLARAEPPGPVDAVISTSRSVLQALLTGAGDAASARASGQLTSTGDDTAAANLLAAVAGAAQPS